jgi:teichuronic acid biosynthesis glycosyltransferase TuaC
MITSTWPTPGRPSTTHFIERQANFLRAAGVSLDVYHFRGRRHPGRYLGAWFGAQCRLLRKQYDLVHAQFGQSGLLALPKHLPLVVTFRGSDVLGIVNDESGRYTWAGRVGQWVSRLVAQRADAVVVVAEHMKRHLPRSVSATVIPSGLDLALFCPMSREDARQRLGLPSDTLLVLFAGRPSQARKRYGLAQAAMEILRQSLPAELIVAWGVPHIEVPLYMNAADALVFTSMQEGSPNVVKEALACNLPVVSVPVGDVAERLTGIEGCELCKDERPETIAKGLERVLRRRRRVNSRVAVEVLDEQIQTARLIDLYRSVLARFGRQEEAGRAARTSNPAAALQGRAARVHRPGPGEGSAASAPAEWPSSGPAAR